MQIKSNPQKQTLVEEGTEFKGTMKSTCPVVVRGKSEGEINAPSITVTETGTVLGDLKAEKIHSEGVLAGSVEADDVFLSGTVRSDTIIRARSLEVKLRPERGKLEVTFGECIIEVGDEPNKAEAKNTDHAAANGSNGHASDWFADAEEKSEGTDEEAERAAGS